MVAASDRIVVLAVFVLFKVFKGFASCNGKGNVFFIALMKVKILEEKSPARLAQ